MKKYLLSMMAAVVLLVGADSCAVDDNPITSGQNAEQGLSAEEQALVGLWWDEFDYSDVTETGVPFSRVLLAVDVKANHTGCLYLGVFDDTSTEPLATYGGPLDAGFNWALLPDGRVQLSDPASGESIALSRRTRGADGGNYGKDMTNVSETNITYADDVVTMNNTAYSDTLAKADAGKQAEIGKKVVSAVNSKLPDDVKRLAFVTFTLKNEANDEALSVDKLFVTAGGITCEFTPTSGATSELSVAVPAITDGRVTLTALSGSTYYDCVMTDVTFRQNQDYTINASLIQVKDIDERPAGLGRVVAVDRNMYASVESAANAGTTALAVIAQVDKHIGYNENMAIAISDESSAMNWYDAKDACEGKKPTVATWLFPTKEYWEQMFVANGGSAEYASGLNTLITTAGGSPLKINFYWTSTNGRNNKCFWRLYFSRYGYNVLSDDYGWGSKHYVRAFLFFTN